MALLPACGDLADALPQACFQRCIPFGEVKDRFSQIVDQCAIRNAVPALFGRVVQRLPRALTHVVQACGRPVMRKQLCAFQVADPHTRRPTVGETDHRVLQMWLQRDAMLEQRAPYPIQQQSGVGAEPQHRPLLPVDVRAAERLHACGADAMALRIAGEQGGCHLRLPTCALHRGDGLPVQNAEALR